MKCNETREVLPDLAAGMTPVTPEVKAHLDSCAECAGKLEAFRQTMALLDDWQAPEPSPYFDVRLGARLREESAKSSVGWRRWLRMPVLAASFALLMVVSVSLVRMNSGERGNNTTVVPGGSRTAGRGRARHGRGRFAGAGEKSESVLRFRCAR